MYNYISLQSILISSKGYPVEEYTVQTKDGYLLGVQRIPTGRSKKSRQATNKPVVFLQHGLLSSSVDWVINFPSQSLGEQSLHFHCMTDLKYKTLFFNCLVKSLCTTFYSVCVN